MFRKLNDYLTSMPDVRPVTFITVSSELKKAYADRATFLVEDSHTLRSSIVLRLCRPLKCIATAKSKYILFVREEPDTNAFLNPSLYNCGPPRPDKINIPLNPVTINLLLLQPDDVPHLYTGKNPYSRYNGHEIPNGHYTECYRIPDQTSGGIIIDFATHIRKVYSGGSVDPASFYHNPTRVPVSGYGTALIRYVTQTRDILPFINNTISIESLFEPDPSTEPELSQMLFPDLPSVVAKTLKELRRFRPTHIMLPVTPFDVDPSHFLQTSKRTDITRNLRAITVIALYGIDLLAKKLQIKSTLMDERTFIRILSNDLASTIIYRHPAQTTEVTTVHFVQFIRMYPGESILDNLVKSNPDGISLTLPLSVPKLVVQMDNIVPYDNVGTISTRIEEPVFPDTISLPNGFVAKLEETMPGSDVYTAVYRQTTPGAQPDPTLANKYVEEHKEHLRTRRELSTLPQ